MVIVRSKLACACLVSTVAMALLLFYLGCHGRMISGRGHTAHAQPVGRVEARGPRDRHLQSVVLLHQLVESAVKIAGRI